MPAIRKSIDWDDLKYFLAVARTGTLRGGAESIGANHATVSRRLNALEEGVDGRLFDRAQSGLVLTQLGEDLLPHAMRVEEEILAASRTIVGRDAEPSGPIHFSMAPFLALSFVTDDLTEFSDMYRDIDLHIDVTNTILDLSRREADVTLRIAKDVLDDVVGRRLCGYARTTYCSREYAKKINDNGGQGLAWIGWNEPEGKTTAQWVTDSDFPHAKLRHRVFEGVPQATFAASGMGLTVLPCFIGDDHPDLVRAPFSKPYMDTRSIWLLLHRDLRKTARVRLLVDFLAQKIRGRKDQILAGFEG